MEWFTIIVVGFFVVAGITMWVQSLKYSKNLPAHSNENTEDTPDKPTSFGYKISWLALRTANTKEVVRTLPIEKAQQANWQTGISAAYNGHTFVSPSVDGWVFVVSQNLPELGHSPDAKKWNRLLQALADLYSEVQYFGTHRVVEYHAWALYEHNIEKRAFAYSGESGKTLIDRGSKTDGEKDLGYCYFDSNSPEAQSETYWEREDLCYPTEQHVMQIAGKWSINPETLNDGEFPEGVGWIGIYH